MESILTVIFFLLGFSDFSVRGVADSKEVTDPKSDLTFKHIFGTEKNKGIVVQFLNDIFAATNNGEKIEKNSIYQPTILNPDYGGAGKLSVLDILVQYGNGTKVVIEMQVGKVKPFAQRTQYYASKMYVKDAVKGFHYCELKKVIVVGIVDRGELFSSNPNFLSRHTIRDVDTNEQCLRDLEWIYMELKKYRKGKNDKPATVVEQWAHFFKYGNQLEKAEFKRMIDSEKIQDAYDELDITGWSDTEKAEYEYKMNGIRDRQAMINTLVDEARQKGEKMERIKIAKGLLKNEIDVSIIAKTTNLSIYEIEVLQNKL